MHKIIKIYTIYKSIKPFAQGLIKGSLAIIIYIALKQLLFLPSEKLLATIVLCIPLTGLISFASDTVAGFLVSKLQNFFVSLSGYLCIIGAAFALTNHGNPSLLFASLIFYICSLVPQAYYARRDSLK